MTSTADPIEDDLSRPLADARLRAFLPLVYVAWADGDLSDGEIETICAAARSVEGMDADCRDALGRWLDPERPPSASNLRDLLAAVRRSAGGLSPDERRTLTALGLELARADGHQVSEAERAALERVEEALGVVGHEVARELLSAARPAPAESPATTKLEPATLQGLLDAPAAETRAALRRLLSEERFAYVYDVTKDDYRETVLDWCRELAHGGYGGLGLPAEHGGGGDPEAFLAAFETIASHDLSLLVKFGVQFGLFAGSIHQLGTASHHRQYLADAASLALPGCFAMTETGHGSNVAELETTARYDAAAGEFEIHTPNDAARKDYIGNAARHGRLATVFAQLEIAGASYGVHAFLVPIRDARRQRPPGRLASRTAATSSGSTASTTAVSRSTGCASRDAICSTGSRKSTRLASTRAPSQAPRSASSRCSGRS